MKKINLTRPEGVRFVPDAPTGTGMLVVAGSSGRIDSERAELLAETGVVAESIRWFGGAGQHDGPWEIPLETFLDRVADLRGTCDRVVVMGTSFGAEAALLTGALSDEVAAVIAFAPSDVVWAGVAPNDRQTSHWTHEGEPLPFVPFVEDWTPDSDPPSYRSLYEASRVRFRDQFDSSSIPAERISELILVAGGDDRVWPATTMAEALRVRRRQHGLGTTVLTHDDAGHRTILPGESVVSAGTSMQRGGNEAADRSLGQRAGIELLRLLE